MKTVKSSWRTTCEVHVRCPSVRRCRPIDQLTCQMLGGTPTAATAACGAAGAARAVMPDPLPSERSDTQGLQIPSVKIIKD